MMRSKRVFWGSVVVLMIVSVVALSIVAVYADEKVDINTATVKELKTIPGIGKVIAERIVEYREAERAFSTVDDLLNVKGIGKATLEKIRAYIIVGEKK